MRISRVQIQNFRNIKTADVRLGNVVTLIGENNSGKSNFLYALTLPFLSDDNNIRKTFRGQISIQKPETNTTNLF